jgi:integrase
MTSLNLLKEVLGDIPAAEINHATMRNYKQILMKLPPNLRKSPAYRDKSIQEVLASDASKRMNTTTINKQLDRASSLFKWAFRNGYMDRNPAEGLQLPAKKRDDEYRAVLSSDDLKKIFHSPEYVEDTHKYGYRFWLPVIALYTGMRLNEICQLRLDDIYKTDDEVYVFDVKEREEETKTKTSAGDRLVPLHDVLAQYLNLPGYIAKLKSEGQNRLFPELNKKRDGYGDTATRWFARYRAKCGITDGPDGKKDFHSLRHTK